MVNDLMTRQHSDTLCIEADAWEETQLAELEPLTALPDDDEDLTVAGVDFERITALAENRGQSVDKYLTHVADRRDELLQYLKDKRKMV